MKEELLEERSDLTKDLKLIIRSIGLYVVSKETTSFYRLDRNLFFRDVIIDAIKNRIAEIDAILKI